MATVYHTLAERLKNFQDTLPLREIKYDGRIWTYYQTGEETKETILFLHGQGGDAAAMFPYITGLSSDFQVIAPNIPAGLYSVEIVLNNLMELLKQLDIQRMHLIGMGFGAALAQVFLRKSPALFADAILTHTVIPSAHLAELTKTQRIFILIQPDFLVCWSARKALRRQLAQSATPASHDNRTFWRDYYDHLYQSDFGKKQLLSRAWIMSDYHQNYKFKVDDLQGWSGKLLIIQSSADEVISEGDQGSLLGMYPRAYLQTLPEYDHLAPILAADEICGSMKRFLLGAEKK